MFRRKQVPVNYLPRVGQISDYLHSNEDFFFDINCADHLMQKLPSVSQKLADLQVRLQLVELLDLRSRRMAFNKSKPGLQALSQQCCLLHVQKHWSSLNGYLGV